ncbi:MAG: hypothetical protein ACPKNR_12685 [Pleomorphochaeta sp.]
MKKVILLSIFLLSISASLFAATITSGVVTLPTGSSVSEDSSFYVEAKASELAQGLLLKYGDNDATATLVTDTIRKSETEAWDVFGVVTTKNFYFFGTGRASSTKSVNVTASATSFANGAFDTGVVPTITGYDTVNGWDITIAAANPVGLGQYTGTSFAVAWDGSNSSNLATTPAGTYTSEITLTVTNN